MIVSKRKYTALLKEHEELKQKHNNLETELKDILLCWDGFLLGKLIIKIKTLAYKFNIKLK